MFCFKVFQHMYSSGLLSVETRAGRSSQIVSTVTECLTLMDLTRPLSTTDLAKDISVPRVLPVLGHRESIYFNGNTFSVTDDVYQSSIAETMPG